MTAEVIAKALGGKKAGTGWMACCPAHYDQVPSLAIRDSRGKVLVHCHAGCAQRDVIAALKKRGLWSGKMWWNSCDPLRYNKSIPPLRDSRRAERSAAALSIWQSTLPASSTPVEAYLVARGLSLPLPSSLRFHPGLKHRSGGVWPCMVALVTRGNDRMPLSIHRTFLDRGGLGKAPVDTAKLMLGPCRGGAVRLAEPSEILLVGEGIETCLSAMQATGYPAWAALSAPGMRALDLPETVREVVVLADGDDPGEAAARNCARRWIRQYRRVRIARAPRGTDFNDVLLGDSALQDRGVP